MSLAIDPQLKAQETHKLLGEYRDLLQIRSKRKGVSPVTLVVIGELLNHLDELEALHCPDVHGHELQSPTEAATAVPVDA